MDKVNEFNGDTNKLQAKDLKSCYVPPNFYLILLTLKSIANEHDKSKNAC